MAPRQRPVSDERAVIRTALVFLLAGFATLSVSAAGAAPSYSCDGRLTATEKAICDDSALASLDVAMSSLYDVAAGSRRSSENAEAALADLRTAQRTWLAERNDCGADAGCLRSRYLDRIGTLSADIGAAAPAAGTARIGDVEVKPDGTMERRFADGGRAVRTPVGGYERYLPDGNRLNQASVLSQSQPPLPPALPSEFTNWGNTVNLQLSGILRNILTPEEFTAYEATEADKDFFDLLEWRLASISFLTYDP